MGCSHQVQGYLEAILPDRQDARGCLAHDQFGGPDPYLSTYGVHQRCPQTSQRQFHQEYANVTDEFPEVRNVQTRRIHRADHFHFRWGVDALLEESLQKNLEDEGYA